MLRSNDVPLSDSYDVAMLDLDGVVYVSGYAVPGAPEHLAAARERGMRLAFITNNASRPPQVVAAHLRDLGVAADVAEVVTSAQAAAVVLRDRYGAGAAIAVLGAAGLREALAEQGLDPRGVDDADVVALVSGYGPSVAWHEVMRAAVRVREGLPWVASNTDLSIPTDFGVAPGHGVMVEMLRRFTGVDPTVAGKPEPPLLAATVERTGARRPLMVGDRLDTDIEGGRRAGADTLLVLTGVTGLEELVAAAPQMRPTYLSCDLGGLLGAHPEVRAESGRASVGGWTAQALDGRLEVGGDGAVDDWWRVVAVAGWAHLDATGTPVDTGGLRPPGRGDDQ